MLKKIVASMLVLATSATAFATASHSNVTLAADGAGKTKIKLAYSPETWTHGHSFVVRKGTTRAYQYQAAQILKDLGPVQFAGNQMTFKQVELAHDANLKSGVDVEVVTLFANQPIAIDPQGNVSGGKHAWGAANDPSYKVP